MANLILPAQTDLALALREPNLLVPGRQPVGNVEVCSKLVDQTKLSAVVSNGLLIDVNNQRQYTLGSAINVTGSSLGLGFNWDTSSATQYVQVASDADDVLDTSQCTMLIATVRTSTSTTSGPSHGYDAGSSLRCLLHLPFTDNNIYWDFGNSSSGRLSTSMAAYLAPGTVNIWGFVAGPRGREIWRNGVLIASNGNTAVRSSTTSPFRIGAALAAGNFGRAPADITTLFVLSKEQWSQEALRALTRHPYALFQPANSTPYLISVPTGGATTINADFISSATSVYEPTITTGAVTISADFVSAATSVYEPTVTAPSGAQDITADFISSATSVHEPTVTTGAVSIAADFISASTAVHEPTLTAGAVIISADFVSATTSVYEPTVFSGSAIVPEFIAATTAVYEPTISTGAVTIAADLIAAGTIVYEPTVSSALTIAADFVSDSTTVYEPTVGVGAVTITADFISSGTIVYEPSIPFGQIISADFIAALSAVYEPSVTDASTIWTEITPVLTIWTEI